MTSREKAIELAKLFHETYERLAPNFGYKTRKASAVLWDDVPEQNKNLMIAVAENVLTLLKQPPADEADVGEFCKKVNLYFKTDADKYPDEPLMRSEKLLFEACAVLNTYQQRIAELKAELEEKQFLIDKLYSQEPCPKCGYGVTLACYGCEIKRLEAENKRLKEVYEKDKTGN